MHYKSEILMSNRLRLYYNGLQETDTHCRLRFVSRYLKSLNWTQLYKQMYGQNENLNCRFSSVAISLKYNLFSIDASFSCVCPVIHHEFQNEFIITSKINHSFFDNVMTTVSTTGQMHWKNGVRLFNNLSTLTH